MIDKLSTKECTLCGSCADACPTGAISFKKEYLDFRYPQIDGGKCVSCGLCEKVCPVLTADGSALLGQPRAYAAKNPDDAIRRKSSSGGIFWALAKTVLDQGGYVCGAVFDEDFRVYHSVSDKEADVRKMIGSKYAQSDLTGVYQKNKALLREGKVVLFTGCPCQVAALRSFLGGDHEKLFTADLICHGTPSNVMLRAYLDHQEKKHGSKVRTICFRDKKYGWHRSAVRILFENGAEYCTPIGADAFMGGFLGGVYLKECCYECSFKHYRSGSDLTLGDFWGAEATRPELDDNTGLSAVLVHTAKGENLLHQCGSDVWTAELEGVVRFNRNLVGPTKKNPDRDPFYAYAQTNGYVMAIEKKLAEPPLKKLRREGRYRLRCILYALTGREKPLY